MHLHIRQVRLVPSLPSCQDVPHAVLEHHSRARQAEGHANVAMRWTLASADTGRPKEWPICGPIEPWDVDADAELLTLSRAMSHAPWWAAITLQNHCLLDLLDCLADELLSALRLMPCTFSWEACIEACLHVVPERLP